MRDFSKLQNGSDIRGVAVQTPDGPEVNLNKEIAGRITLAFCDLLARKLGKKAEQLKIAVGRDSRISGDELKEGVLEAMRSAKGFIKKEIGRQIRIKHMPELIFKIDTSLDYGRRMDELITKVMSEQEEKHEDEE